MNHIRERNVFMAGRIVLGLLCLLYTGMAAADAWYLLGREGGCFPIGPVLVKKVPEAADIADPDAFVRLMQQQGHEVSREDRAMPHGRLTVVRVPALGLALGFGDQALCQHYPPA